MSLIPKANTEKMATLEGYKSLLDETLARLVDVEARLAEAPTPSLDDEVEVVQEMYYDHEVSRLPVSFIALNQTVELASSFCSSNHGAPDMPIPPSY